KGGTQGIAHSSATPSLQGTRLRRCKGRRLAALARLVGMHPPALPTRAGPAATPRGPKVEKGRRRGGRAHRGEWGRAGESGAPGAGGARERVGVARRGGEPIERLLDR